MFKKQKPHRILDLDHVSERCLLVVRIIDYRRAITRRRLVEDHVVQDCAWWNRNSDKIPIFRLELHPLNVLVVDRPVFQSYQIPGCIVNNPDNIIKALNRFVNGPQSPNTPMEMHTHRLRAIVRANVQGGLGVG